jgi:hypothetical protein
VEAGLWSGTEGPARFLRSPLAPRVLRILAEVTDPDPMTAPATAHALLARLTPDAGRFAERDSALGRLTAPGHVPAPVLLHGEDAGAWPVLRLARRLGLATRVGLEDTLFLPDGRPAASNAELVTAAMTEAERSP